MKKYLFILLALATLIFFATSADAQVLRYFTSAQLAPDPQNGLCLTTNGATSSWATCGTGGGGYPGGTNGQLQFNNAGTFGGTSTPTVTAINATSTTASSTLPNIILQKLQALTSAGMQFFANSGTPVADFGAGGGSNASFFGGVNIDGQTRIATNLTGVIRADNGVLSTTTVAGGSGTVYLSSSSPSFATGQLTYVTGAGTVAGTSSPVVNSITAISGNSSFAGFVGIGSTSPARPLSVNGTSIFTGELALDGINANIALGSNWLSGDGGDEGVFVNSSGNVGIGTSTFPASTALRVSGGNVRIISNDTIDTGIEIANTSTGGQTYSFFSTGSANNPGNFGVYSATYNKTFLSITGSAGDFRILRNAVFGFSSNADFTPNGAPDTAISRRSAGVLAVGTGSASSTAGTLMAANLVAGTTTQTAPLFVASTNGASPTVIFNNSGLGSGGETLLTLQLPLTSTLSNGRAAQIIVPGESFARGMFYSDGAYCVGPGSSTRDVCLSRGGTNTLAIDSNKAGGSANLTITGNLGIGTTSPSARLTISGDMRLTGRFADSSSSTGAVGSVLTATANGTQWVATSSLGIVGGGGPSPIYLATSTGFTVGQVAFATGPGTVGSTPTTTLTETVTGLELSGTPVVLGGTPLQLALTAGFTVPSTTLMTSASSFFANPASLCLSIVGLNGTCYASSTIPTAGWTSKVQGYVLAENLGYNLRSELGSTTVFTDSLKPLWIGISATGSYEFYASSTANPLGWSTENQALFEARSGKQVMPFVSDSYDPGTGVQTMLEATTTRTAWINAYVADAVTYNWRGITLDIEGYGNPTPWTVTENNHYKTFVRQICAALHAVDKICQVYLPPIWNSAANAESGTGDAWDGANSSGYYVLTYQEYEALGVDFIEIPLYDYEFDYGAETPEAPLRWITDVINFAKSKIDDDSKIVIGISAQGHFGPNGYSSFRNWTYEQARATSTFVNAVRDNASGELFWTCTGGINCWAADDVTMDIRRSVIEAAGIEHISIWYVGNGRYGSARDSVLELNRLAIGTTTAVDTSFSLVGEVGKFIAQIFTSAGNIAMSITNNGNVGIATTSPSARFTVQGDMRLTGRLADSSSSTGAVGSVLTATANGTRWVATSSLGISGGGGFSDPLTTNGDIIARVAGVTTRLAQGGNGTFLGVSGGTLGYYTPAGSGTINSGLTGQLAAYNANGTTLSGTSSIFIQPSNGFIGIGTTTPSDLVTIRAGNMQGLEVQSTNSGFIGVGKIGLDRWRLQNDFTDAGLLELLYNNGSGGGAGNTLMAFTGSGSGIAGRVGIGTTTPPARFSVVGQALLPITEYFDSASRLVFSVVSGLVNIFGDAFVSGDLLVGTTNYNGATTTDKMVVDGYINQGEYIAEFCTSPAGETTAISADTLRGCGRYAFILDSAGRLNFVTPTTGTTSYYRLTPGTGTAVAAGDGMGLGWGSGIDFGDIQKSAPAMEWAMRQSVLTAATSTQIIGGLTSAVGLATDFGNAEPTQGFYVFASSTANYLFACNPSTGGTSYIDTGIASSSTLTVDANPFVLFRLEVSGTSNTAVTAILKAATSAGELTQRAACTLNLSASTQVVAPTVAIGKGAATTVAGPDLHVPWVKFWYRTPLF